MGYILVWLNMMRIQIKSKNSWLETLLKQSFSDLKIENEADIFILENNSNFYISSNILKQEWHLTKPVSLSTIINILNQVQQLLSENIIVIGPINFYPNQRFCIFNNKEISLTQKEAEILSCLAKSKSNVDKTTLLGVVWGYAPDISTYTLETHIYKLRNKFNEYEIISSNDEGYILNR